MKDPGGKKLLPTNVTEITFTSAWILTCPLSSLALCMIVVHCNSLPPRIPLAPSPLLCLAGGSYPTAPGSP
uniref:Uncharacterized protein n=1 Tax=Kalanchoe fedtschenkoi TaxID=63787 RepID=A0A7N0UX62_KALFE